MTVVYPWELPRCQHTDAQGKQCEHYGEVMTDGWRCVPHNNWVWKVAGSAGLGTLPADQRDVSEAVLGS